MRLCVSQRSAWLRRRQGDGLHDLPARVGFAGGANKSDGADRARFFRPTSNRPDQRRAVGGLVAAIEEREMRLERRIAPPVPLRKNAFARRSSRRDDRPRRVDGYDDRAEVRRRIDGRLQLKRVSGARPSATVRAFATASRWVASKDGHSVTCGGNGAILVSAASPLMTIRAQAATGPAGRSQSEYFRVPASARATRVAPSSTVASFRIVIT